MNVQKTFIYVDDEVRSSVAVGKIVHFFNTTGKPFGSKAPAVGEFGITKIKNIVFNHDLWIVEKIQGQVYVKG